MNESGQVLTRPLMVRTLHRWSKIHPEDSLSPVARKVGKFAFDSTLVAFSLWKSSLNEFLKSEEETDVGTSSQGLSTQSIPNIVDPLVNIVVFVIGGAFVVNRHRLIASSRGHPIEQHETFPELSIAPIIIDTTTTRCVFIVLSHKY